MFVIIALHINDLGGESPTSEFMKDHYYVSVNIIILIGVVVLIVLLLVGVMVLIAVVK